LATFGNASSYAVRLITPSSLQRSDTEAGDRLCEGKWV